MSIAHLKHGVILQYKVAPSIEIFLLAAWQIAFCSAWMVRTQCCVSLPFSLMTVSRRCPASSQCCNQGGDQTYPVARICLSFTITQPLLPRSQVALLAMALLTSVKYSSRVGLIYVMLNDK